MKTWLKAALLSFTLAVCVPIGPAIAQGTLKVAIPANLNTLDPAKTKSGDEYVAVLLIYSRLVDVDAAGKARPDLAESWSSSDDLKTWTFKLRPGAKFHHGRTVDAEDVKMTIERLLDPATGSAVRANFSIIDKIEVVDSQTVRFLLKIPYAAFAELLSDRQACIVPRDKLDVIASQPSGSGPFVLKQFVPGDRVDLVKNADYFIKDRPRLDGVSIRIMPETAARVAALTTGEIDLVWELPPEAIDQFKDNPDVVIDSTPTSSWDGIIMNGAQRPFDDVRVRRAVQAAIDKTASWRSPCSATARRPIQ